MQEVPAGSYIVFLTQPQRYNVVALFEPQIYPNRLTALGEAERPYDVAGWTLPLQMGVDAPAVVTIRETASERKLTLLKDANEVRADLALALKKGDESPIKNPLKQPVRVGIYRGSMGNMDEGWTRFVFDTFNVPYYVDTRRRHATGRTQLEVRCGNFCVAGSHTDYQRQCGGNCAG